MTKYLYLNGNGEQRFFCLPPRTKHIHWIKIGAAPQLVALAWPHPGGEGDVIWCPYSQVIEFKQAPPPGLRNVKVKLEVRR